MRFSVQALPIQTFLHPDAHVDGGLAFVDKQLLESQRAAVLQLMKEVCLSEERASSSGSTYLQKLKVLFGVCRLARNC